MVFLIIFSLLQVLPPPSVARDRVQDDAHVVSAVLTQTVRREVDKRLARPDGWRGSPLVILLDRTIPMCPDKSGPWEDCVDVATLRGIRQPWWTEATSLAFTQRNARSMSAPLVQLPIILTFAGIMTGSRLQRHRALANRPLQPTSVAGASR